MFTARFKHSISLLFLAFFLTTKLAGLHALTHDDSIQGDDCAICHVLITNDQTPVVLQESDSFSPQEFQPNFQEQVFAGYQCTVEDRLSPFHLFSRPPPAI